MRFSEIINEDGAPKKVSLTGNFDIIVYTSCIERIDRLRNKIDLIKSSEPIDTESIGYYENVIDEEEKIINDMTNYRDVINNVQQIVKSSCNKYVNIFKQEQRWLYRGINGNLTAFESESLSERRPLDSSAIMSKLFDGCATQLGIKALRLNSIFTSSSKQAVQIYGNTYIIIPEDSADFSCSLTSDDIVLTSNSFDDLYDLPIELINKSRLELSKYQHLINDDDYYLPDKHRVMYRYILILKDIIKFKQVDTRFYTLDFIEKNFPNSTILHDLIEYTITINLDKFQKKYQITNSDMPAALQSRNEVLIHGKYIAINHLFWPMVKKLL